MLHHFSYWLGKTWVSNALAEFDWIVPTIQSLHIAAIAMLMASVLVLDLRLVGLVGTDETVVRFSRRYLPWIWWSLPVLLVTGVAMVIGEPGRTLFNPTFYAKMVLLLTVIAATLAFQKPLLRDAKYWESQDRRVRARVLGWASLALWLAILCCGRWIAYTTNGAG